MSKRADAPYREGRGGDWRKAKCRLSQEVVIGGWTLSSDGRRVDRGARTWASTKTGSSCTRARSAPGSASACSPTCSIGWRRGGGRRARSSSVPAELQRGAHWVEPDLVAQVEFTQWTDEGRMRQPVFLGLREDREARHVVRERPGTVEGGGVDTVAAGRPWEALRQHATRTRAASGEEIVDAPRRAPDPSGPRSTTPTSASPSWTWRSTTCRSPTRCCRTSRAARSPSCGARTGSAARPSTRRRRASGRRPRCGASRSRERARSTSSWTRCPGSWPSPRPASSRSTPGTRGWRGSRSRTR